MQVQMRLLSRIDWQCKKCKKIYNMYRYRYRPKTCVAYNATEFEDHFRYFRSWECRNCGRRITT